MEKFIYNREAAVKKEPVGMAEGERSRREIYEASKALADYISQEGVKNVFFLDNSARQAHVGLQEIWKNEHAEEEKPGIYFINPDPLQYQWDFEACAEEFWKYYKNVNKEEKLLIYDVCIHSGNTLFNVKDFFDKMGFEDVRLAVTSVSDECSPETQSNVDLICLKCRAAAGCHPFGKQTYIKKTGSLISKSSFNEEKREQGQIHHEKIKQVFKEGLRLN